MNKEQLLQVVADLYIEGYSSREIAKLLPERCPNAKKFPSDRTIRQWIQKNKEYWNLRRKQKEVLKVEKANEEQRALEEKIQFEIDKADALDYQDLCDLQRKYKEIAMTQYKPRAVEVVIQCIKLKREIREGLKPESENKITIVFEGAPEKSNEVVYED
jgi:transposase